MYYALQLFKTIVYKTNLNAQQNINMKKIKIFEGNNIKF